MNGVKMAPFGFFWVFEFAVHRVVSGGLPHLGSEQRTEQFWKCTPIYNREWGRIHAVIQSLTTQPFRLCMAEHILGVRLVADKVSI